MMLTFVYLFTLRTRLCTFFWLMRKMEGVYDSKGWGASYILKNVLHGLFSSALDYYRTMGTQRTIFFV